MSLENLRNEIKAAAGTTQTVVTSINSIVEGPKMYLALDNGEAAGINITNPTVAKLMSVEANRDKLVQMLGKATLRPVVKEDSVHLSVSATVINEDGKLLNIGFINNIVKDLFLKDMPVNAKLSMINESTMTDINLLILNSKIELSITEAETIAMFA